MFSLRIARSVRGRIALTWPSRISSPLDAPLRRSRRARSCTRVGEAHPIFTSTPNRWLPCRAGKNVWSACRISVVWCTGSVGKSTLRSWPVGRAARAAVSSKVRCSASIPPTPWRKKPNPSGYGVAELDGQEHQEREALGAIGVLRGDQPDGLQRHATAEAEVDGAEVEPLVGIVQDRAAARDQRGVDFDRHPARELDVRVQVDEAQVALRGRLAAVQGHHAGRAGPGAGRPGRSTR